MALQRRTINQVSYITNDGELSPSDIYSNIIVGNSRPNFQQLKVRVINLLFTTNLDLLDELIESIAAVDLKHAGNKTELVVIMVSKHPAVERAVKHHQQQMKELNWKFYQVDTLQQAEDICLQNHCSFINEIYA